LAFFACNSVLKVGLCNSTLNVNLRFHGSPCGSELVINTRPAKFTALLQNMPTTLPVAGLLLKKA
jgi:hypothetical protein